jgi:phosphatidylinositol alpha-1,6-mannosyltransferase
MRVLLITTQFAPELGGVPRLLEQFCAYRPAEVEVRVLSVQQQSPKFYTDFDRATAYPIERVMAGGLKGVTSLRVAWRLWRAIGTWHPDVILCGVAYPSVIVTWLITRLTRTPYVSYTHSEDILPIAGVRRRVLAQALRSASAVITVSRFTQHALIELGIKPVRINVIPPGIEVKRFATRPDTAAREAWTLLTVGRLVLRKGQDTVIRALPQVAQAVPHARYMIVGDGPDAAELRNLAVKLGVADRVVFAGRVADADLPGLYQACDVFVLPTRSDAGEVEGFGIVFLEAGAAGKPVIAGRAGGTADAVLDGATGLLIDPLDVQAVVEAIIRLAHDTALAQHLGAAGRDRVCAEFSVGAFAARVTHVLRNATPKDLS